VEPGKAASYVSFSISNKSNPTHIAKILQQLQLEMLFAVLQSVVHDMRNVTRRVHVANEVMVAL
jgi:hypothetical protein